MNAAEHTGLPTADYLTTLGLQQAPYLDSSDARFFYADPSLVQRLDLLQHLTQFGDMLLGVSGPVGSGKTTLAQQFLLRGNTAWRSCRLNGAQIQQPAELLAKLAECFGLQTTAAPERLRADLVRHCQALRHNTQLAVVVIDDAQQLPDPALKALLELADDPRETLKLLRVVLFSEPGLEQRLAVTGWHSPQQPLLHNLDIPRLDEQQTAAYLMYRLAVAGYSGESPFSPTEIRALHKATDGLPGKLNVLAHETLIERAGRIASRKNAAPPIAHRIRPSLALGLISSLAAGGLAWYLGQKQTAQEPLPPPVELATTPATSEMPTPSPKPVVGPVPPAEPAATPEEEPQKSLETTPETNQPTEIKEEHKAEALSQSTQPTGPNDTATDTKNTLPPEAAQREPAPAAPATAQALPPIPDTVAPATNIPVPPRQPAVPTDTPAKPTTPPEIAATTPAPMATPAPKSEPEPAEKSPPGIPTTAALAPPALPASASAVEPKPSQLATATAATGSEQLGTDWLQSRPGSRFTLQLLGGRSEKSLREYLKQNRVPEPVATFRTVYKGADWYVLVHGDFESMAVARAATATLPAAVHKGKPWARSFASVHADMQKTRPHRPSTRP